MRVLCQGSEHLKAIVQGIIDYDGEGVVLRKINSFYEPGRSANLLKLKVRLLLFLSLLH
jgi:ATP-dependent DNA ligase